MNEVRERDVNSGSLDAAGAIAALVRGSSIEILAKNLAEVDACAVLLPAGTDVYVASIPGTPYHHVASVARRLRLAGMNPVPHIAARQIANAAGAGDFFARLHSEAQVTRALVIAGDSREPVGPYGSSLDLIRTGLLQAHGIRSIGISGYPEGHRDIAEPALLDALEGKIQYAARNGIDLFIVSQFCFDADAVLAWLRALRARGVNLPVHVGVAGPATIRTLLNFGKRCGIGNSLRAIGSQGLSLTRLMLRHGPEKMVRHIAHTGQGLGIEGLHLFAFGGFAETARWIENVGSGRFRLSDPEESFCIDA